MKFLDKVILITGGSSGIGLELTRQFLNAGAMVAITGQDESKLQAAKQEFSIFGSRFLPIISNVTSPIACKNAVEKVNYQFKRIDVLINNAGISACCEIDDIQLEVIDKVLDTNLKGAIYMTNYTMPYLIKTKGSVLFISSIASFIGLPEYSLYCASKKALTAFAQSLEIEAYRKNVFIGTAYLSFTENEIRKRALDANGNAVEIPKRNSLFLFSREQTAKRIIKQLTKRKRTSVHGIVGKSIRFLSQFPFIINRVMKWNYKRNN